jgi:hypothetical protein
MRIPLGCGRFDALMRIRMTSRVQKLCHGVARRGLPTLMACFACLTSYGPDRPADVTIQIRTEQQPGSPLPFAPISFVGAWHGTDLRQLASVVQSDSLGLLALHDTLSPLLGFLDSVVIRTYDPRFFCTPTVLIDTVFSGPRSAWALTLTFTVAPPKLAPGEYCGLGLLPSSPTVGSEFDVHLQIDSITDSIRGVWQIVYVAPIATQAGAFSGVVNGPTVDLYLESTPAPSCLPSYRLVAATLSDSTLGLAHLEPAGGCSTITAPPLRLVRYDAPYFP